MPFASSITSTGGVSAASTGALAACLATLVVSFMVSFLLTGR